MRYLLLCCFDETCWNELSRNRRDQIMQEYREVLDNLVASGHYRAGGNLAPSATATTLRERDGKPVVTDGPFAQTREQLGGYHLVECRDLDAALAIARRIPTLPAGGAIEVRPLALENTHDSRSAR